MAVREHQNIDNEILLSISKEVDLTPSYITFMVMSGILATVALLANSVPILIGAMVVAPVFAPLALSALALVGGQYNLARKGFFIAVFGLFCAVLASIATTWLLNATGVLPADANLVQKPLMEERLRPGWYSAIAAMAAGIAGTIAIIKNKTDTLIGTVAAVALVPAGSAAGIALLSGDPLRAWGGLILLVINIGLIIAFGILVTLIMRPSVDQRKPFAEQS